jgi:hypothetical protein
MSLDGFIAGPDDEMARVFEYSAPSAIADEVITDDIANAVAKTRAAAAGAPR